MIALLAQAACGSAGTPTAATTPSPAAVCKTIQAQSKQVTLNATDSPTPGFALDTNTQPVGIIRDNDGQSAWLLGTGADVVIHVLASGDATVFQLQKSGLGLDLAQASDGTVWIPEQFRDAIVSLASDGTARECALPGKDREPVATSVA